MEGVNDAPTLKTNKLMMEGQKALDLILPHVPEDLSTNDGIAVTDMTAYYEDVDVGAGGLGAAVLVESPNDIGNIQIC